MSGYRSEKEEKTLSDIFDTGVKVRIKKSDGTFEEWKSDDSGRGQVYDPKSASKEHTIKFPSAEVLNDIAATGSQTTTEKTITVSVPTDSSIRRAMLITLIHIMNDSANAQKINVQVDGRVAGGTFSAYWGSLTDCVGLPAVDAASTGLVAVADVSALVTAAGTYGFRLTVAQDSAHSVHYTTQFILVITYRMG